MFRLDRWVTGRADSLRRIFRSDNRFETHEVRRVSCVRAQANGFSGDPAEGATLPQLDERRSNACRRHPFIPEAKMRVRAGRWAPVSILKCFSNSLTAPALAAWWQSRL